jgi:hypothetical protein
MHTWPLALGFLLCGPGAICGQTAHWSATLTVHVTDAAGSPIQDADVTPVLTELWGPVLWKAPVTLKTDRGGEVQFRLSPGIYRIDAAKLGFENTTVPNLEAGREDSQQLTLVLEIATAKLIPADTPCHGECVTFDPAWLKLIEAAPLAALIELKPPVAPLALQPRSATKGMLRQKPQHS